MTTQEPTFGTTAERLQSFAISEEARERAGALAAKYWEAGAYAFLLVSAVILRFWNLGARAIHHDESLHAYYGWGFAQGLERVFTWNTPNSGANIGYAHVPFMHGPFQFIGSGFFQWIFGDGDAQSRLLAAVMGTAMVPMPFLLRKQLGMWGALAASAFIAFSPTLTYFSRFTREDIYTAFWTLGMVVFAWRYIDSRKSPWLFATIGFMAGSFLTKETTYLTVIGFLFVLDVLLAHNFTEQLKKARPNMEPATQVLWNLAFVVSAWLIALTWPLTEERRKRYGILDLPAEADVLVVMGTIALPLYAAFIQILPASILGHHAENASQCAGQTWRECVGVANLHLAGPEKGVAYTSIFGLMTVSAVAGLLWRPKLWAIAAACFWVPYFLLSTTFFTNIEGFISVLWGSLDYWVSQQHERRGDQPDYYYFITIPTYEFLPLALSVVGGVYYMIRGKLSNALIFGGVATLVLVMLAIPGSDPAIQKCHDRLNDAGAVIGTPCKDTAKVGTSIFHVILPFGVVLLAVLAYPMEKFTKFIMFWLVFTVLGLTIAGEKMPWLNVHIALPLAILAGKFVGDMLGKTDIREDLPRLERLAPFLYAATAAGLAIFVFVLVGPFDVASLGAWALCGVAAVSVYWAYSGYSPRTALQVAMVAAIAAFGVFTIRATYLSSWGHPDNPYVGNPGDVATRDYGEVPLELLVYTQTSGDIPALRDRIAEYARMSGKGSEQPVVVDSSDGFTWPWAWYLRDFAVSYATPDANYTPPQGAILLIANSNASNLTGLQGYGPGIKYHHRRWFQEEYRAHKDDTDGKYSTTDFFKDIVSPHQWGYWLDFWISRDNVFDEPGTVDGVAFFPLDAGDIDLTPDAPTVRTEGTHLVIGGNGFLQGQLDAPSDVALDAEGNLYVADTVNDRIQKYDANGNFVAYAGGFNSDVVMQEPWSVAVAPDGTVFVASTWSHTIIKLDKDLKEVKRWGAGGQVTADDDDPFKLFGPRDIVVALNGNVLITDTGNERIIEYTADGEFVRQFGKEGTSGEPLEYLEPVSIAVNDAGDIYVGDFGNRRIVVLDAQLNRKAIFDVPGWGATQNVTDRAYMALLGDGRIIVSDPTGKKITVLSAAGEPVASYDVPVEGNHTFARPIGVATDGTSVYVADSEGSVVRKIPLAEIAP
jgi:predicted membrane-bound mannosyltransferase/sugar lactone lactonase YvrE